MTLSTNIYLKAPTDRMSTWQKVNTLLDIDLAKARTKIEGDVIYNLPGQGFSAWVFLHGNGKDIRKGDEAIEGEPDHYLCVNLDTAYGHQGPHGGCSGLHRWVIHQLGEYFDAQGIDWAWRDEFTGTVFDRYDGLETFGKC